MTRKSAMQYTLLILCFFAACHLSQKAQQNMPVEFDKQGHRGCRGLMPENTWPAMKKALDLQVTTLEMDVVITADKKVVLSHEPWMGHEIATKPNGEEVTQAEERSLNIYKMTYDEVKKFDVGLKAHPRFPLQQKLKAYKPLLSEIFDSVAQYMSTVRRPPPFFNIETKSNLKGDGIFHPAPPEFVELLMEVIKEKGFADQVIIQSFDVRTLQYLHKNYPQIKTALLIEGLNLKSLEKELGELGFIPAIYSPAYQLVTNSLIKECHSKGMKIIPWTVNDKKKIDELKSRGVDGIITDYPDLFD